MGKSKDSNLKKTLTIIVLVLEITAAVIKLCLLLHG
jgi:hypothetical protein